MLQLAAVSYRNFRPRVYKANFRAARAESSEILDKYQKMLTSGENVLLDADFLHCFLDYVSNENGEPDPEFLEMADAVSDYHAGEFADEFDSLYDLLEWLVMCDFLTVRRTDNSRYHIVFPSEQIRWFIERSAADLPIEIEEG